MSPTRRGIIDNLNAELLNVISELEQSTEENLSGLITNLSTGTQNNISDMWNDAVDIMGILKNRLNEANRLKSKFTHAYDNYSSAVKKYEDEIQKGHGSEGDHDYVELKNDVSKLKSAIDVLTKIASSQQLKLDKLEENLEKIVNKISSSPEINVKRKTENVPEQKVEDPEHRSPGLVADLAALRALHATSEEFNKTINSVIFRLDPPRPDDTEKWKEAKKQYLDAVQNSPRPWSSMTLAGFNKLLDDAISNEEKIKSKITDMQIRHANELSNQNEVGLKAQLESAQKICENNLSVLSGKKNVYKTISDPFIAKKSFVDQEAKYDGLEQKPVKTIPHEIEIEKIENKVKDINKEMKKIGNYNKIMPAKDLKKHHNQHQVWAKKYINEAIKSIEDAIKLATKKKWGNEETVQIYKAAVKALTDLSCFVEEESLQKNLEKHVLKFKKAEIELTTQIDIKNGMDIVKQSESIINQYDKDRRSALGIDADASLDITKADKKLFGLTMTEEDMKCVKGIGLEEASTKDEQNRNEDNIANIAAFYKTKYPDLNAKVQMVCDQYIIRNITPMYRQHLFESIVTDPDSAIRKDTKDKADQYKKEFESGLKHAETNLRWAHLNSKIVEQNKKATRAEKKVAAEKLQLAEKKYLMVLGCAQDTTKRANLLDYRIEKLQKLQMPSIKGVGTMFSATAPASAPSSPGANAAKAGAPPMRKSI